LRHLLGSGDLKYQVSAHNYLSQVGPSGLVMLLTAPLSAKISKTRGPKVTLMLGQSRSLLGTASAPC
jgi:hypothetical protein